MELKRSFIIIEVLISIFIIFLVIVNIVVVFKQNLIYNKKIQNYQNIFITVKSILNLLDSMNFDTNSQTYVKIKDIKINNFKVIIYAKEIKSQRNFVINSSDIRNITGGFTGKNLYKLFKIKIVLLNNSFKKEYFYFLTKVYKI